MLVPAGALTKDDKWVTVSKRKVRFLVPQGALARKFWGRFMHLARRALPQYRFPDLSRRKRWIVYCKETVQGSERVLEYLGRYVNRTALSNHAILACTDQAVTFRYRDSRDHKTRVMTLHPHEFLRRFLQHVPPRGFHRVRQFGLLHARQRHTLRRLQLMLGRGRRGETKPGSPTRRLRQCPTCHSTALRNGRHLSGADDYLRKELLRHRRWIQNIYWFDDRFGYHEWAHAADVTLVKVGHETMWQGLATSILEHDKSGFFQRAVGDATRDMRGEVQKAIAVFGGFKAKLVEYATQLAAEPTYEADQVDEFARLCLEAGLELPEALAKDSRCTLGSA